MAAGDEREHDPINSVESMAAVLLEHPELTLQVLRKFFGGSALEYFSRDGLSSEQIQERVASVLVELDLTMQYIGTSFPAIFEGYNPLARRVGNSNQSTMNKARSLGPFARDNDL